MTRREFRGPDGTTWTVDVSVPGASNAMVIFHHPDGSTSRKDRYAWFITRGPEARSVTARMSPDQVMKQLDDRELARLFRRSMRVSAGAERRLLAG
jgi:hypothetical protein